MLVDQVLQDLSRRPCSAWAKKRASRHAKEKTPEPFGLGFQILVRLAGIEPTTPWFVAKYSIQLSYSRKR